MADNVTLNSGSGGASLATDEIASVHHQRVKIQYGTDGAATDVSDTNPLPIDDAGGSLTVDNAALSVTGGGVEASALRVTLANDSTGVLSIDDNGGSLTVDGTVTANLSATDNAVLDTIETNTDFGTVTGGGVEASALRVTLANDSTGVLSIDDNGGSLTVDNADLTTLAGAVHNEDAAHTTGDAGVQALAVRNDSDTSLAGTTGDYTPLQTDSNGYLKVNIKAGAGSGGTASTDDSAFTAGSGSGTPMMGFATSDVVDAGDVGVLAMDTSRNLKVSIEADNAGIGGGTQYAIDTALGATPTGTLAVGIRDDALSTLTPVEGDAIGLRVDSVGALWTTVSGTVTVDGSGVTQPVSGTVTANLSATDNAVLDQIEVNTSYGDQTGGGTEASALRVTLANDSTGVLSVDDNGGSLTVDNADITTLAGAVHNEDEAHTTADPGIQMLAVRNDDLAALAGTDGDYAPLQVTQNGALLTCPSANDDYKYAVIDAATSGDNTLVAAVASRKIRVISAFLVANGDVTVRFESGAAGTALTGQMDLTTNSGFTLPHNPAGWFETAVNTLLNLELDAAVSVDGCLTYIEVP